MLGVGDKNSMNLTIFGQNLGCMSDNCTNPLLLISSNANLTMNDLYVYIHEQSIIRSGDVIC